jgi:hypothetical protein
MGKKSVAASASGSSSPEPRTGMGDVT